MKHETWPVERRKDIEARGAPLARATASQVCKCYVNVMCGFGCVQAMGLCVMGTAATATAASYRLFWRPRSRTVAEDCLEAEDYGNTSAPAVVTAAVAEVEAQDVVLRGSRSVDFLEADPLGIFSK